MRYLNSFVFCLILLSCAEGELESSISFEVPKVNVEIPDVELEIGDVRISKSQSGLVSLDGNPFSGYLISKYPNDSIALKQGYLDGLLNGETTGFYPNGELMHVRPYLNGEKHGEHIGYHENGTKEFQYYFADGFSVGNHKKWYPDGSILSDMNYKNGKEFGKQQVWRPDGKLRANYVVRENGRRYGLQGIKRCTKLDGVSKTVDPYKGEGQ